VNLDPTPISALLDFGSKLVERLWPDPQQRLAAQLELQKLHDSGDLSRLAADTDLAKGQIEVNKVDAASGKFWNSGWRPGVGWVGVVSLALIYWPKAIVLCVAWCFKAYAALKVGGEIPVYPDLGLSDIVGLLTSLLGFGTMRTYEKRTGTEGNR
jgi:hypothetical protein